MSAGFTVRVIRSTPTTSTSLLVPAATNCRIDCPFDAGLLRPDGTPRPVYAVFKARLAAYSR